MKYTCPKCGKHIEVSTESLISSEYKIVCPQCLAQLEIVGDYAYIPPEDGSLLLDHSPEPEADNDVLTPVEVMPPEVPQPPVLPTHLGAKGDPLYGEAVKYVSTCMAITPMMLRDYFNISPERAQELIREMEANGVIGPYNNGGPRQILIPHQSGMTYVPPQQSYDPQQLQQQVDLRQQQRAQGGVKRSNGCANCLLWVVVISLVIYILKTCSM